MSITRFFNMPVKSTLKVDPDWEIEVIGDHSDPVYSFSGRRKNVGVDQAGWSGETWRTRDYNAFEVREDFFQIREPREALAFLRRYGPWYRKPDLEVPSIQFSALIREREFYEDSLLNKDPLGINEDPHIIRTISLDEAVAEAVEQARLWYNLPMEMVFQQPPVVIVKCQDAVDAVRAAIFLDKLDQLPWKRCAREGCRKLFQIGSQPNKKFCGPKCSHYQQVIDYNNSPLGKAKAAERKARGKAEAKRARRQKG